MFLFVFIVKSVFCSWALFSLFVLFFFIIASVYIAYSFYYVKCSEVSFYGSPGCLTVQISFVLEMVIYFIPFLKTKKML